MSKKTQDFTDVLCIPFLYLKRQWEARVLHVSLLLVDQQVGASFGLFCSHISWVNPAGGVKAVGLKLLPYTYKIKQ